MSLLDSGARVVSPRRLPARLPLQPTLLLWLVLDRLAAPGWVWGVAGTLLALVWLVSCWMIIAERYTDPFIHSPKENP